MNKRLLKTLLALCAAFLMCFCFAWAEKYSVGDADIPATVKNLDIQWTSGRVRVVYHDGDGIHLRETARKAIPEDQRLRWQLDGDTLRVLYEKPGLRLFRLSSLEKELTLELPEGIALNAVSIEITSGEISIPALRTESLRLAATSGDIRAAAAAGTASVDVTSGDVALILSETAQSLSIHTTSGDILVAAEDADKVSVSSTSGNVEARLYALSALKINTTSGDVRLYLPEAPGFTARLHTTSGSIHHDLPLVKQGANYICGDGSGDVDVSTTSGNISLFAEERE